MTASKTASSSGVIIDNATLRGALIALGLLNPPHTAPNESIKVFDVHIASAEVLIESMLLYDHIYVPKIHKEYPNIVAQLQATTGQDLIRELPLTQAQLQAIEKFAEQDFASWPLATEELRSRLREFVGLEVSPTEWDRWIFESYNKASVIYYDWHLYTRIMSEYNINHVDTGEAQNSHVEFLRRLPSLHAVSQFNLQDAAVLWLAYRTCVYDCISWATGIPYVPHPQRAALWKAMNFRRSQPALFATLPFDILFDARIALAKQVNTAMKFDYLDLNIPPFFTYILAKSSSPFDVFDTMMRIRQQKNVKALRTLLGTISASLYEKGVTSKVLELEKQFNDLKDELTTQYREANIPKISPSIQLAGMVGIQFDLPIPENIRHLLSRTRTLHKPHLAVLRDVFAVTSDIWKLSYLYDKLYRGRQILVERTINPPKALYRTGQETLEWDSQEALEALKWQQRAKRQRNQLWFQSGDPLKEEKILLGQKEVLVPKSQIEDPEFNTPLECREKLKEFLLENPTGPCQVALIDIDNMDEYNNIERAFGDAVLHYIEMLIREKAGANPISKVAGDTFIIVVLGKISDDWLQELRTKVSDLPLKEWVSDEYWGLRRALVSKWYSEWYALDSERRKKEFKEMEEEEEEWVNDKLRETLPLMSQPVSISAGLSASPTDGNTADSLFKIAYERLREEKRHKHGGA